MISSRWSVLAAFALVGAATQLLWLNYAGVTTTAAEHFGVSETAVGWLAQVFPLLYVVLAVPCGIVLDRWFRAGLAAGAILTAAGAGIRLIGDGFIWALAGQTVAALAQPLVLNAITGIAGRYLAEKDRPTGIAAGTAATFAGMVLAFVLAAVFPDGGQLQTLVAISAAFAIVAAALLSIALRTPGPFEHTQPPIGLGALRIALQDRFIRRLCVLVFFPFGAFIALSTFAQALLEPAGVSADTASVILLVNVVAGVAGCAIIPIVATKLGKETALLALGAIVTATVCVVLAIAPTSATAFVGFLAIGFTLLPSLPIVLELVERRTGEVEGTAAGLIWMSGNLGGLVVATVVGLLVDHPGPAFAVAGVAVLAGLPLLRSISRVRA